MANSPVLTAVALGALLQAPQSGDGASRFASLDQTRIHYNPQGTLEARAGAAWSAVEVYDGTRHQLRVELFGSGSVLTMEVEGDRVVAAALGGVRYQRSGSARGLFAGRSFQGIGNPVERPGAMPTVVVLT